MGLTVCEPVRNRIAGLYAKRVECLVVVAALSTVGYFGVSAVRARAFASGAAVLEATERCAGVRPQIERRTYPVTYSTLDDLTDECLALADQKDALFRR